MTPLDIEVLLHFHCSPKPHPRAGEAPAVDNTINNLCSDGLITPTNITGQFVTTDRGDALVRMLCSTPYPKKTFIDPRTGKPAVGWDNADNDARGGLPFKLPEKSK